MKSRQYRKANKDDEKYKKRNAEYSKKWARNNKKKNKEIFDNWRERNLEYDLERVRKWQTENKEYFREYANKKYKEDIQYKLARRLRGRLWDALKNDSHKAGSAIKDLGCSLEELKDHIESRFVENMSWGNYGEWHIDHIKPLASFDLTDRKQFLEACHFTNLQPLWAKENISKGARA